MEAIIKMVQNITAFLLISGIIGSMLKKSSYRKYFSYVSGLVVLILFLSPVMSLLAGKSVVKTEFNSNRYEKEKEEFLQELEVISENSKHEFILQYEETLCKQVAMLCSQSGVTAEARVSLTEDAAIERIEIFIKDDMPLPTSLVGEIATTYGVEEDVILIRN